MLQRYFDEAGNPIATEEFEPNREPWNFAQVLPSISENYRCCACGHGYFHAQQQLGQYLAVETKVLGLTIPPLILARADEVIE